MCFCSETVPLRPGPEPFSRCAGQLAACPARTDSCPQRKKPRPRGLSIQYQFGKNNHFRELSSLIQTILSVLELHQISRLRGSRTVTAGGELHPAPKNCFHCWLYCSAKRGWIQEFFANFFGAPRCLSGGWGGPEGTKIAATPDPIRNPSHSSNSYKAGEEGLEPPSTVLETAALPLNYSPLCCT